MNLEQSSCAFTDNFLWSGLDETKHNTNAPIQEAKAAKRGSIIDICTLQLMHFFAIWAIALHFLATDVLILGLQ